MRGSHEGPGRDRSGRAAPRERRACPSSRRARCRPPSTPPRPSSPPNSSTSSAASGSASGARAALTEPGDYVTSELAGQPVVVLRDRDGGFRAFSNVCLHRMSTLLTGSRPPQGRSSAPTTPGPTISTARCAARRRCRATTASDREDCCLPQIRCEVWQGWIFVTLNPDAAARRRAPRRGRGALIADFGMESLHRDSSARPTSGTPTGRCSPRTSWRATTCRSATPPPSAASRRSTNRLPARARRPSTSTPSLKDPSLQPRASPTPSNTTARRRLAPDHLPSSPSIPRLLITLTPGYFWYLSLHPEGPGQVHITFGGGLSPDFVADPDAPAALRGGEDAARRGQRRGPRLHRAASSAASARALAAPGPPSATSSGRSTTSPATSRSRLAAGRAAQSDGVPCRVHITRWPGAASVSSGRRVRQASRA